ncbi:MAG: hypothetical protein HZA93_13330 [Verrucomicrobia bacterium]|nr:hypothetical protein [Verrucomicrobiota bacterium]
MDFAIRREVGLPLLPGFTVVFTADGLVHSVGTGKVAGSLGQPSPYSWRKTGPTTASYSVDGEPERVVTFGSNGVGSFVTNLGTNLMTITPFPTRSEAPVRNGSTRLMLAAGQASMMGFVVGGAMPRRMLVRAIGPSLAQFGVANPATNPVLTVQRGNAVLATNSGWGGSTAIAAVFTAVRAFSLPAASRDCALVLTLPAGAYTAQVTAETAGEILIEVYFVD